MVLLWVEDGGGCLQLQMGPSNIRILNRPLRTADRLLSSSLGTGWELTGSRRKGKYVKKFYTGLKGGLY
jgi:hypothetical protein